MSSTQQYRVAACALPWIVFAAQAMATTDIDVSIGAAALVNDNFYSQSQNEEQVAGMQLSPAFNLRRSGSALDSSLSLSAIAAAFNQNDVDNYVDYDAKGGLALRQGLHTLALDTRYRWDHDPFGDVRTEGQATENQDLDQWEEGSVNLSWTRDGQRRGSVFTELDLLYVDRRYTSNESFPRLLDRDGFRVGGVLGYNFSARSGVFLNLFHSEVRFDEDQDETALRRSGETDGLLVGLRWKATARTGGNIRIGRANRESDSGVEFESTYWNADLSWQPSYNDSVELSTARSYEASYFTDTSFFDTTRHAIRWTHNWGPRFTSRLSSELRLRDFVGTANREDDETLALQLDLEYAMDQAFSTYALVRRYERESSRPGREFEANLVQVGIRVQLN